MNGLSTLVSGFKRIADRVRKPEYTGENRCLPCTLVNSLVVAVAALLSSRRSRLLGVAVAAVGAAAVAFRGYVVPGTPRFAPRLVAPLPVEFGPDHEGLGSGSLVDGNASVSADGSANASATDDANASADGDSTDVDQPSEPPRVDASTADAVAEGDSAAKPAPEDVMAALVDASALVDDGELLSLDDDFRTAWIDRTESLDDRSEAAFAERVSATAGPGVDAQIHDGRVLLAGDHDVWLSRPIALAETAAASLLQDRGVDPAVARLAATPLRELLDTCPLCGGAVEPTTLRKCCGGPGGVSGSPERTVRACADCDSILFAGPE